MMMKNPLASLATTQRVSTLEAENRELRAALERLTKRAHLVDIRRNGRMIMFDFTREGTIFTIETIGMMSDDVAGWKQKLCS